MTGPSKTLEAAIHYVKTGDTGALKELKQETDAAAKSGQQLNLTEQELAVVAKAAQQRIAELRVQLAGLHAVNEGGTPKAAALRREIERLSVSTPKSTMALRDMATQIGLASPLTAGMTSSVTMLTDSLAGLPVAGQAAIGVLVGFGIELAVIKKTMDTMQRGGGLLGSEGAFNNLLGANGDNVLNTLRGATEGTVSRQNLVGVSVLGVNAELSIDQLKRITAASNDLSAAYEQELVPMLQQHIPNAAAGAFRSLKQYGLGVEDIAELEATATDKTEAYIQAMEQLAAKVGPGQDGASDAVDKLHASWATMNAEMEKSFAKLSEKNGLVSLFDLLGEGLHNSATGADFLVLGLDHMFKMTPPGWVLSLLGGGANWLNGQLNPAGPTGMGPGGGRPSQRTGQKLNAGHGYLTIDSEGNSFWVATQGPGFFDVPTEPTGRADSYINKKSGGGASRYQPSEQEKKLAKALGRPVPASDAERRALYANAQVGADIAGLPLEEYLRTVFFNQGRNANQIQGTGQFVTNTDMLNYLFTENSVPQTMEGKIAYFRRRHPNAQAFGSAYNMEGLNQSLLGGMDFASGRDTDQSWQGSERFGEGVGRFDIYGRSLKRDQHIARLMREDSEGGSAHDRAVGRRMQNRDALMSAGFNIAAAGIEGGARGAGVAAIQEGLGLVVANNPALALPLGIVSALVPGLFKEHERKPAEIWNMRLTNPEDITGPIAGAIQQQNRLLAGIIIGGGRQSLDDRLALQQNGHFGVGRN